MPNSDLKWISAIAVKNSIINNENETHLEIFFLALIFCFIAAHCKRNWAQNTTESEGILPAAVVNKPAVQTEVAVIHYSR
jgi:hypothetical protein